MNNSYIQSLRLKKDEIDSFEKYPYNLDVIKNLDEIFFHKNVTFILGENGSGKSTLLEALAVEYGLNPEGGSNNINFRTKETHSKLSEKIIISKGIVPKDKFFLRAESFYNVSSEIDNLQEEVGGMLGAYGGKSLHQQSHGEGFFSLFLNRFGGNGVYILDEPEAALSPQRQLAFLIRLDELVKQNSQFIIITHSPIILSYPNSKILEITENGINEVLYKDTNHYNTYKMFLDNPEYMLRKLKIKVN
ncbi:MAG: AAA family ATPase [Candidatus Gracilibacteria bacterium]|nr:AAA family ATPase [Candidatus Gracilibacteria bacterium]